MLGCLLYFCVIGVSGSMKKVSVFDEDQSKMLPAEGAVVMVDVSCVRSPTHFYVVLPWGPFTVEEVTDNTKGINTKKKMYIF